MSHKLTGEQHTKLHQTLQGGSQINGYSHTVCVRKEKQDTWISKGYKVIQVSEDSVLLGKKNIEETEAVLSPVVEEPVVEEPVVEEPVVEEPVVEEPVVEEPVVEEPVVEEPEAVKTEEE